MGFRPPGFRPPGFCAATTFIGGFWAASDRTGFRSGSRLGGFAITIMMPKQMAPGQDLVKMKAVGTDRRRPTIHLDGRVPTGTRNT